VLTCEETWRKRREGGKECRRGEGKDGEEKEGMEGRRKGERGKGRREREVNEEEGGPRNKVAHDVHGIIFPFLICCTYTSFIQRTMLRKQLYMVDIHNLPRPVSLP